jgi:hypothetical protein
VQLRAELLSPPDLKFEIRDASPLPSSPAPENQNKNEGIRKLAIRASQVKNTRLAVLLTPEPQRETKLVPLAEW